MPSLVYLSLSLLRVKAQPEKELNEYRPSIEPIEVFLLSFMPSFHKHSFLFYSLPLLRTISLPDAAQSYPCPRHMFFAPLLCPLPALHYHDRVATQPDSPITQTWYLLSPSRHPTQFSNFHGLLTIVLSRDVLIFFSASGGASKKENKCCRRAEGKEDHTVAQAESRKTISHAQQHTARRSDAQSPDTKREPQSADAASMPNTRKRSRWRWWEGRGTRGGGDSKAHRKKKKRKKKKKKERNNMQEQSGSMRSTGAFITRDVGSKRKMNTGETLHHTHLSLYSPSCYLTSIML